MKITINKKDVVWSFLNYGANVLSNMVVLMFAVAIMPNTDLGMWYTFLSLGAIMQLVDFGFLPCITRSVSYAWTGASELLPNGIPVKRKESGTNYKLLGNIVSASRIIYTIMTIVVGMLCLSAGNMYILHISPTGKETYYMFAWLVYSSSLLFNIYFGYWTGCLQGIGAIRANNQAKVISYIVLIVVSMICLLFSFGLFSMPIGYLMSGVIYRILAKRVFVSQRELKGKLVWNNLKPDRNEIIKTLKGIWPNAWKMGVNSLGTYFITQGNTLLCSAFLGLEATATYGLTLQICNAIVTIAKIMMTVYQPRFVELNLERNKEESAKTLSLVMITYWLIIILGGIGLVAIGIPAISLLKSDTALPYIIVIYMLLYLALEGNHSCFASYITTQNQVPFFTSGIISAIAVFLVSLLLVKTTNLEIWALMLGQSMVQLIYNNWKWPYVVLRDFAISPLNMFSKGVGEIKRMICHN